MKWLDIFIFLVAVFTALRSWQIWYLIKGNGRIVTSIAFSCAACVRALSVFNDWDTFGTYTFPTAELQVIFWILITIGMNMLYSELVRVLRRGSIGGWKWIQSLVGFLGRRPKSS
jgi:hypothetical protein